MQNVYLLEQLAIECRGGRLAEIEGRKVLRFVRANQPWHPTIRRWFAEMLSMAARWRAGWKAASHAWRGMEDAESCGD